jgi:guanine deaminase|tara:strand:+ start:4184 stop:5476 length:1293 start_codon:yes stop_codon:yes gene_type:complete
MSERLMRGPLLHCLGEPDKDDAAIDYRPDALLWLQNGLVHQMGDYESMVSELTPAQVATVEDCRQYLMVPGFVDCHIHYPQTEMIGAYGTQLLDWLNTYTFPVEANFKDPLKAASVAKVFINQLLNNGTTTALVFCSVHPESVDALFTEAQEHNMRIIAGKVMMDRNAPSDVLDTVQTSYDQSKQLIQRWHGVDRLQYAVTPRFAPTSTDAQLAAAGRLLAEHKGVYLHTHLSENVDEIEWVKALFPSAENYLDVYDQAGLLGKRSVFAHGIYLCDQECERLAATDSAIAHCPSSNLFMGSGLFPMQRLQGYDIKMGMGTDVGGGTSFNMLQTLADSYKVQQLKGHNLSPEQSFYLATLGGAKTLDLSDRIGNFARGKEADFLLLDPNATDLLEFRTSHCEHWRDLIFVLQTMGDDRVIAQTNVMGVATQ